MNKTVPSAFFSVALVFTWGCGGEPPSATPEITPAPPAPAAAAAAGGEPGLPRREAATAKLGPAIPGSDVADEYTRQFCAGELRELFGKFSDEMKTVLPFDQLEAQQAQFREQFGRETQLIHRESKVEGDHRAIVRWARFENYDGVIGVEWILRNDDDAIAGFFVRPAQSETPPPKP